MVNVGLRVVAGVERLSVNTIANKSLPGIATNVGMKVVFVLPTRPVEFAAIFQLLRRGESYYAEDGFSTTPMSTGIHPDELALVMEAFEMRMCKYYDDIRTASLKGSVNARMKMEQILNQLFTQGAPVTMKQVMQALSRSSTPNLPGQAAGAKSATRSVSVQVARKEYVRKMCVAAFLAQFAQIQKEVEDIHSKDRSSGLSVKAELYHFFATLKDAVADMQLSQPAIGRLGQFGKAAFTCASSINVFLSGEARFSPARLMAAN